MCTLTWRRSLIPFATTIYRYVKEEKRPACLFPLVKAAPFILAPASCALLSGPVGNFRRTLSVFGSAVSEPERVHVKTGGTGGTGGRFHGAE